MDRAPAGVDTESGGFPAFPPSIREDEIGGKSVQGKADQIVAPGLEIRCAEIIHILVRIIDALSRIGGIIGSGRFLELFLHEQTGAAWDLGNAVKYEPFRRSSSVIKESRAIIRRSIAGRLTGVGIIAPIDGIGPSDLPIEKLVERVKAGAVQEVILALSTGMEGETTAFYLYKKLSGLDIRITAIARGIGFGDDLEYADELTLGKSIENRQLFKF